MNNIETKELEKRLEELEKANQAIKKQLRSLQLEVDTIEQRARLTPGDSSTDNRKITYLTEANEQMFQQLIRLRQLIEHCIETNEVPSHVAYYEALKGDI